MANTNYKDDKKFTDYVHKTIIVPNIYTSFGWKELPKQPDLSEIKDSLFAIDYEVKNRNNEKLLLQERFRRSKYHQYNDFTLRYERNENQDETEQKSEFYKIKSKIKRVNEPFYLLYGLLNNNDTICDKYVVIDLRKLFQYIEQGRIIPDDTITSCLYKDNCLHASIKYNSETNKYTGEKYSSSSMICFDVIMLGTYFQDIILYQKGFFTESKTIMVAERIATLKGYIFNIDDNISDYELECLLFFLNTDGPMTDFLYRYLSTDTSKIVCKYLSTIKYNGGKHS